MVIARQICQILTKFLLIIKRNFFNIWHICRVITIYVPEYYFVPNCSSLDKDLDVLCSNHRLWVYYTSKLFTAGHD